MERERWRGEVRNKGEQRHKAVSTLETAVTEESRSWGKLRAKDPEPKKIQEPERPSSVLRGKGRWRGEGGRWKEEEHEKRWQ